MRLFLSLLVLSLGAAYVPTARAQDDDGDRLRIDYAADGAITGSLALSIVLAETVLKGPFSPDECRWCEPPRFDVSIRDAFVWDNAALADSLSYGSLGIGVGVSFLDVFMSMGNARWKEAGEDSLIIGEAMMSAMLFNELFKWTVGRQRPGVHFGSVDISKNEQNVSFFSGHTTLAFTSAAAGGMVAWMRGRKTAAASIWSIGGVLGLSTAYFRIAADRHYASDVLVGMAVGTLFGLLEPWLFHRGL